MYRPSRTRLPWLRKPSQAAGLALLICFAAFQGRAPATILYVSMAGADANDGLSWQTAKRSVAAGLGSAVSGDQVWVAGGTYVERITLAAGVALYGGLAGNEPPDFDLSLRDFAGHPSILDDDAGGSVVTAPSGATSSTRIDGFTIRNGTGTLSGSYRYGGGIYCNSSSPTISNNTITGCTAEEGAGIYLDSQSPAAISHNTITGNAAITGGGGISCASSATISNNTIDGNCANGGGGIGCTGAPVISGNRITRNIVYNPGGGIYCSSCSPLIMNNLIAANKATAENATGGGVYCSYYGPPIFNNTIVGNQARDGGGIYGDCSYYASQGITNNVIAFNSSGLYFVGGKPSYRNNCVYNPGGLDYTGTAGAGTSDIRVDPKLVDASVGEVHLMAGSPCIDAGLDSVLQPFYTDLDGQSRSLGAHVDIGADEFDGTTPAFTRRIVRVSPSGDNANDGSTWASARRTVQAGLDAVTAAGGGDVWVAAGTYNERVTLKAWAHLYGGFAGTETGREQRNWAANATVLDGSAGGSVVTISSAGYASTTIDGFTIRNGTGTGSAGSSEGGGIHCEDSSPTISHNTITANQASFGGGIYCYYASPVISGNTINGNGATSGYRYGGGIYCYYGYPVIFNNAIISNTAGYGGGAYWFSCRAALTNNTIAGNTAILSGGGVYSCSGSYPRAYNNIVAFNSSGLSNSNGSFVHNNNCVHNPGGVDYEGEDPSPADISGDPLFVNRTSGDYGLAPNSPCIDAGNGAKVPAGTIADLRGHLRFFDDPATPDCRWAPGTCGTAPIVDMGAYEFIPPIPGDYNGDGDVDLEDLALFEACQSGPSLAYTGDCAKADLDPDGDVDQDDFGLFQRCLSGLNHPADPNCHS